MKEIKYVRLLVAGVVLLALAGCQQSIKQHAENAENDMPATGAFGESFAREGSIPAADLAGLFVESDTVEATISGHIGSSCKHSGCWMDVDMGEQESVHITFLEEGFTIPLDAAGKNAVAKGIAIREMIPVETLKNYAREDGKSEEEIAAITEPEWEYGFIASGVIIEE